MDEHILRKHIEEIIELTDDKFTKVLAYFQKRTFKKHQIVLHEGDYAVKIRKKYTSNVHEKCTTKIGIN